MMEFQLGLRNWPKLILGIKRFWSIIEIALIFRSLTKMANPPFKDSRYNANHLVRMALYTQFLDACYLPTPMLIINGTTLINS